MITLLAILYLLVIYKIVTYVRSVGHKQKISHFLSFLCRPGLPVRCLSFSHTILVQAGSVFCQANLSPAQERYYRSIILLLSL
jgi:hypothetical protein